MSYQPQFPGMFDPDNGAVPAHEEGSARDARAALPPTEKQMHYATSLSLKTGAPCRGERVEKYLSLIHISEPTRPY